jgi:hypothetical protein
MRRSLTIEAVSQLLPRGEYRKFLRKKYQKVSKDVTINDAKVGNPQYDPRAMVKLLLYGYSYGIKSSRKLERECHHNMSFIWLM